MELKFDLITAFQRIPNSFSWVLSFLLFLFAVWVTFKKTANEESKNISEIQASQTGVLINQIKLLSDELDRTRKQLSDLHLQNLELMVQLRDANKRISELEMTLLKSGLVTNPPH
jgi:septal ring factor EnvC (AmiA/AmiB activator)